MNSNRVQHGGVTPVEANEEYFSPIPTEERAKVSRVLSPVIVALQGSGLFHNAEWVHSHCQAAKRPRCCFRVYSLVVVVMLWLNLLRLFAGYAKINFRFSNVESFLQIGSHIWFLKATINATIMFRICDNPAMLKALFAKWKKIEEDYDYGCVGYDKKRARITVFMAVCLMGLLFNAGGYLFATFAGDEYFTSFAYILTPFNWYDWSRSNLGVKLVFFIPYIYGSLSWYMPLTFFAALSYLIVTFQCTFNHAIRTHLADDGHFTGNLGDFRLKFLRICDLIDLSNESFQNFIGFNLIFNTCTVCTLIYYVINVAHFTGQEFYLNCLIVYWLLVNSFEIIILSYGAGVINDKAYDCLYTLHRIRDPDIRGTIHWIFSI